MVGVACILLPGGSAGPASWRSWDGFLANVRRDRSAVLVVRGEPGIGKTELLRQLIAEASGFGVARVAGVESEMELPFAGLYQLCAPMLGRLGSLAEPQCRALSVAFGLASGDSPDPVSWSASRRSA